MPFDFMKKTMMTGIGFALKTREDIDAFTKEFIEKTKMNEEEGRKFFDEMIEKYNSARDDVQKQIDKAVQKTLDRMDLSKKSDTDKLKKELAALKKEINALKKNA